MVVVPMLLTDGAEVEEQIERLEVHYLANPAGDLRFAILSDWMDAPTERMPGDDETLGAAREGIARLNRRHGAAPDGGERFLLFHRRRLWNESERAWMGWERKRGKLHELNRLLRGATDTSFVATGAVAPSGIRYVITLDADTRLPRGAVDRLVGTMAHPLNRPRLDPGRRRVVEGYAVLQPRVTPPLPGREGSFFQRLSSGPAGIDPYAAAVSDVYQDLWGEGSYTGKGIYDVDAFEAALAGRVPENALLSHDLFEGVFARAGLVTDVELFESAPSHFGVAAARQHRWARGDWQLLPWILGSRIPVIGRWKMLDNLRRTASAPAAFLTLVVAWVMPGTSPMVWSAFVLATVAVPPLLPVLGGLIPRGRGISKRSHTPRDRPGSLPGRVADRAHDHDADASGLADERCDRADARPRVWHPSPAAGMDDRGAGQGRSPSRPPWLLPSNGRRCRARRRRRDCRRVGAPRGLARRAALSDAVGGCRRRWRDGSACRGALRPLGRSRRRMRRTFA